MAPQKAELLAPHSSNPAPVPHGGRAGASPDTRRSTSDSRSEISLFPDSAGNKGRFAQPTVRFPIFGINDNMLVVVWGLGVLRRVSGECLARLRRGYGAMRGRQTLLSPSPRISEEPLSARLSLWKPHLSMPYVDSQRALSHIRTPLRTPVAWANLIVGAGENPRSFPAESP